MIYSAGAEARLKGAAIGSAKAQPCYSLPLIERLAAVNSCLVTHWLRRISLPESRSRFMTADYAG
jgi:hypothetical protein